MGVSQRRSGGARSSWLTWAVLGGLVALFAGERVIPEVTALRVVFSGAGVLLIVGATLVTLR